MCRIVESFGVLWHQCSAERRRHVQVVQWYSDPSSGELWSSLASTSAVVRGEVQVWSRHSYFLPAALPLSIIHRTECPIHLFKMALLRLHSLHQKLHLRLRTRFISHTKKCLSQAWCLWAGSKKIAHFSCLHLISHRCSCSPKLVSYMKPEPSLG